MEERKNKNAITVALFVLVAIAIFVAAVFTLGGQQKAFTKKFPLKVVFADINGLKEGSNVWFSGVKIGIVTKIELKGFSDVEITMMIEEKSRKFIRKDGAARIGSEGLLGNKLVNIYGGSDKFPQVEDNDFLHVQKVDPSEDLTGILTSGSKNLLEITANFKQISKKIADGEGSVGMLINNPSYANSLQGTLENFKTISENSKKAVSNIEVFTSKLNSENSSINKMLEDKNLYDSIRVAVNEIKQTAENANDFANRMSDLAAKLSASVEDTTNLAGKVLSDKEIAEYLENTIKNLETASIKLNEDLEAMKHNFLTRKYFKHQDNENKKKEKEEIK